MRDKDLPALLEGRPLREHRLYQADWLLRFYGFRPMSCWMRKGLILMCFLTLRRDWALRHLEFSPVEVNRADYQVLLGCRESG